VTIKYFGKYSGVVTSRMAKELSCSNSWPNYSNCQSMDVAWQNKFKIPSIWQNSERAKRSRSESNYPKDVDIALCVPDPANRKFSKKSFVRLLQSRKIDLSSSHIKN